MYKSRVKGFSGLEHAKNNVEQLTHRGADDGHLAFATRQQAFTESAHDRIVGLGDDGRQVQRLAQVGVASFSEARAAPHGAIRRVAHRHLGCAREIMDAH